MHTNHFSLCSYDACMFRKLPGDHVAMIISLTASAALDVDRVRLMLDGTSAVFRAALHHLAGETRWHLT